MKTPTLDSLPLLVILEICDHLDLKDLVSFSQVSSSLFSLSKSSKSYWLSALFREELAPLLPSHLPLVAFSGEELRTATIVALKRERNMMDEYPKLISSNHIAWPYSRSPSCSTTEMPASTVGETPSEAIWMHLTHPNGQWLFMVSKKNVIRVLHLPSGTVAWEEWSNVMPVLLEETMPYICFAVDFMGDDQARVAMVILVADEDTGDAPSQIQEGESLQPFIRIVDVRFNSVNISIQTTEITRYRLPWRPAQLDIAGDHIAFVETASPDSVYGEAPLHLTNWTTGRHIKLPELLPSTQVSTFQSYLVSLGLSKGDPVIQIISFPTEGNDSVTLEPATPKSPSSSRSYELVASIQLPSPNGSNLSPLYASICHNYKGATRNQFRIWVRDQFVESWSACWSVYEIPVDFSRRPLEWFVSRPLSSTASPYQRALDQYSITHRQVFERPDPTRWIVAVGSGKRFFWWSWDEWELYAEDGPMSRENSPEIVDAVDGTSRKGKLYRRSFLLYSSNLSECSTVAESEYLADDFDLFSYADDRSIDYPERCMETRIVGLTAPDPEHDLYALDCEEASGVVVIIWRNGSIDVLRYI